MTTDAIVERLEINARVFEQLFADAPAEQIRWKPSPDKWSLLEVLCHLLDEEREDFRARIDLLLHHPGEPWPPIDPEGWVAARDYASRALGETLAAFLEERRRSVSWLRGLESPDWSAAYDHPSIGRLQAGDLLASWLAHDFLHLRQLSALQWQFHEQQVLPFDGSYAGSW